MKRIPLLVLALIGLSLCLSACGDDVQFADPPERDTTASAPGHIPGHGGPSSKPPTPKPAGSPSGEEDPFGDAEVTSPSANASSGDATVFYRGEISVDPAIKLPDTYCLFVSAGFPPRGRPPVLSIKVDGAPKFPVSFELTKRDIAFGSTHVDPDKPLVLYVTLSESGMIPMPGQPSKGAYIRGSVSDPHKPGKMDVQLRLNKP